MENAHGAAWAVSDEGSIVFAATHNRLIGPLPMSERGLARVYGAVLAREASAGRPDCPGPVVVECGANCAQMAAV
jgi:hypothetical protein